MTAIWWIRRDLRLADNRALTEAVRQAGAAKAGVIPLFVFDPALLNSAYTGQKWIDFLTGGLISLHESLLQRGSRLVVRRGDPLAVLQLVMAESGATAIYAQADHSPYAVQRDARISAALPLHLVAGVTALPPGTVVKADGTPYTVFTPFKKRWLSLSPASREPLLPSPARLSTPESIASEVLPSLADTPSFPPGEEAAWARLTAFTQGAHAPIFDYANTRNRPDWDDTSRLSPYLRLGMLSPRQALVAAQAAGQRAETPAQRAGVETWISELIWREFFVSILHHFPGVRRASFRPDYAEIDWRNDRDEFAAWCTGRTGYPFVDAALRQLTTTGWMHNRARMVVASFLVKHLLIDWRWGERFFMQHLLDGDPAANNGGWQWVAGTGTDAAPYFRVFNPITQSRKFDPDGAYIRRWVPELADVPTPAIHTPWKMSAGEQARAGCHTGTDYPSPLVEHAFARQRALETYKAALNRTRATQSHRGADLRRETQMKSV
ncbi:MAG: deoxyribodipyrimidine photo-lyase [Caldilineaceae bacterium]